MIESKEFKPLRNDVLLRLKPKSDFGVVYFKENTDNDKAQFFYVDAVGPDVKSVKVGDLVVAPWTRITPPFDLRFEGKATKFGLTAEVEIMAVVED